jgi:hypothetical protein
VSSVCEARYGVVRRGVLTFFYKTFQTLPSRHLKQLDPSRFNHNNNNTPTRSLQKYRFQHPQTTQVKQATKATKTTITGAATSDIKPAKDTQRTTTFPSTSKMPSQ